VIALFETEKGEPKDSPSFESIDYQPVRPATLKRGLDRLQILAWLEANRFPRRDGNFLTSARISSDSRFSRFDGKDSKTSKLNAIILFQGYLHGFENRVDCHFRFGSGNSSSLDNLVNDI
jgi:hypothetical protein